MQYEQRRTMPAVSEFWAGLAGVLVGGALSLIGVWLTLRNQSERDRKTDQRGLRDREHDRIREAYREVVAAGYHIAQFTMRLNLAFHAGQSEGKLDTFFELLKEPLPNVSGARATLLLEAEQDHLVLEKLDEVSGGHLSFYGLLIEDLDEPEGIAVDKYGEHLKAMQKSAKALAEIARHRLAALQKPVE